LVNESLAQKRDDRSYAAQKKTTLDGAERGEKPAEIADR
jgi:hypothetical protein